MERFDVAVIGGGIAGVSLGCELAADRSLVLLEQEDQLAVHTTGRSAAVYVPTYGNEVVRALTRASRDDFDRIQAAFDTPPLLTPRRLMWLDTVGTPEARAALAAHGSPILEPAEVPRHCPILRPEAVAGAVVGDAMDIDVMALHAAYVRGFLARGGRIERSAPAHRIRRLAGRWQVSAGNLDLEAEVVVNAAGAWGDVVAAMAGAPQVGLQPMRRTLFVTPVEGHDTSAWPLVVDGQERFYFKPEVGSLLASPADETPVPPDEHGYDEADVARALETIDAVTSLELRRVTSAWAGLRTFAPDRTPVVGDTSAAPGFFWFAGQGGYGIQMAPALARTAAAVLRGEHPPADVRAEGVTAADLAAARFG